MTVPFVWTISDTGGKSMPDGNKVIFHDRLRRDHGSFVTLPWKAGFTGIYSLVAARIASTVAIAVPTLTSFRPSLSVGGQVPVNSCNSIYQFPTLCIQCPI